MKNNDDNIHRQRRQTNHTVTNRQFVNFIMFSIHKNMKEKEKIKKTDRKMMETLRITVS